MTVDKPFVATVRYVKRDKKNDSSVKPYILHYAAPKDFPQNNFAIEPVNGIGIHSLRTAGLSYEDHGMTITSIDDSNMQPKDFDDDDWIESHYLPKLHDAVCLALGAKEMTVFDWMLRKRSRSFPKRAEGEENVDDHQPSLSAHIDYTEAELNSRVDAYFGSKKDEMLSRRYQVINIWKPLLGPCRDFPLAFIDPTTVDTENDLVKVDEVFPTVANEVFQVYSNPNHRWYYVPDQLASEVVIFNAYDSVKGQQLAVPHCSFDCGEAGSGIPRQSIEVRAFVFY
ncbi:hypothetical protein QBC40DRAFT_324984 [Triangularia verruculosa]|uniref:Methyltransferase n=1 Tax=Triangularia verruculosa TaxID=2587418 RepID=A0AAN6XJ43_9PEZI|nr:hypothetical protein QBC40DRAFT_324984 [Triangularia verruculosa]